MKLSLKLFMLLTLSVFLKLQSFCHSSEDSQVMGKWFPLNVCPITWWYWFRYPSNMLPSKYEGCLKSIFCFECKIKTIEVLWVILMLTYCTTFILLFNIVATCEFSHSYTDKMLRHSVIADKIWYGCALTYVNQNGSLCSGNTFSENQTIQTVN